jgi:hypothetical protein
MPAFGGFLSSSGERSCAGIGDGLVLWTPLTMMKKCDLLPTWLVALNVKITSSNCTLVVEEHTKSMSYT